MAWKNTQTYAFIVLEPEDWSTEEWKTISKVFGVDPKDEEVVIRIPEESCQVWTSDE